MFFSERKQIGLFYEVRGAHFINDQSSGTLVRVQESVSKPAQRPKAREPETRNPARILSEGDRRFGALGGF